MKVGTTVRDGRGYVGKVVDVPGLVPGGTLVPVRWTVYPGRGLTGGPNIVLLDADDLEEVIPQPLRASDFKIVDEGSGVIYLMTHDGWYIAEISKKGLRRAPGLQPMTVVPFDTDGYVSSGPYKGAVQDITERSR